MMKIGFYKGNETLYSKVISWWTRGQYTHAELIVANTDKYKLSATSRLGEGVRFKIEEYDKTKWEIIEVEGFDENKAINWFELNVGKPYDVLGIFGLVLRRIGQDRNKYFCSEAVGSALGFEESWRLDPNTLYIILSQFKSK